MCNSRTEEEGPASMVVRETQSSARRYHCSLITWAGITKIAATGTARSLERGPLKYCWWEFEVLYTIFADCPLKFKMYTPFDSGKCFLETIW